MALTAPTAPTPPTPPVVPGARQEGFQDNTAGQEAADGAARAAEMGRGFGVHITINPSGQAASGKGNGQENTVVQTVPPGQQAGAEQGKAAEKPAPAKDSDAAAAEVAQQARQAAVQRMLGEEDGSQQQAEAAVRTDNPWLPSGNMSFMTVLPFVIVFVAAFITFTLRSLGKKNGMAKPEGKVKPGRPARQMSDKGQQMSDKGQGGILSEPVQLVTAPKEDKSKGRHFEMRI
ncbi:MAG: hypothetical protein ACI3U2_10650 [Anaerovibrio sp.]